MTCVLNRPVHFTIDSGLICFEIEHILISQLSEYNRSKKMTLESSFCEKTKLYVHICSDLITIYCAILEIILTHLHFSTNSTLPLHFRNLT